MFGPGTKSLLSEGLKKRQPSTSEESEKSEEVWIDHLSNNILPTKSNLVCFAMALFSTKREFFWPSITPVCAGCLA